MILKPSRPGDLVVKGIVFDMDGTLTQPQSYMFKQMREALNIVGKPIDILGYMAKLEGDEQREASEKVQQVEYNAMVKMQPQPGVHDLFQFMHNETDLKFTICTRNNTKTVKYMIDHLLDGIQPNEPVVTRSFEPPKPSPIPLLHISRSWNMDPQNMIMVGDSRDDMFAGLQAGFTLVLMKHKDNSHLIEEIPEIDYVIDDFHQLIDILQDGFISKPKKPRMMEHFSGY